MAALTLSAVIHLEDDLYVAECPELGTVSQGASIEAALAKLKEATELFLEEQDEPVQVAPAFLTTFSVNCDRREGVWSAWCRSIRRSRSAPCVAS